MRASAGPGRFHEGFEEVRTTWLFLDDVIRHEFRARPKDLHIVTINGASVEPLSSSGDRTMVDISGGVPTPSGNFVRRRSSLIFLPDITSRTAFVVSMLIVPLTVGYVTWRGIHLTFVGTIDLCRADRSCDSHSYCRLLR